MNANKITLEIETENILNLLTAIEYLKDDLTSVDCPDFECNGYELLKTDVIIEKLAKLVSSK